MSFLKEYFGWIPLTFRNIFRNKRRSFSMISGIILGTLIFSGIFVYVDVLQSQTYETVVESAVYEVQFNILENETIENLQTLADTYQDDPRIVGSSIITQPGPAMSTSVHFERTDDSGSELPEGVVVDGGGQVLPTFVGSDFAATAIGQELLSETFFQGDLDLQGNSTVIPRSFASRYRLQVGDVLEQLNFSILSFAGGGNPAAGPDATTHEGTLENVEISGIYEIQSGDAGLFGDLLNQPELYFSDAILETFLPDIFDLFRSEQTSFLASKINIDQFTIGDPDTMNQEVQQMINDLTSQAADLGFEVRGSSRIQALLIPFQIINVFVTIFQIFLAIPVVILSFYLLIYGVQLSLEERRREIGIKKVQGADSRQIFGELRNETIIIFAAGLLLGYLFGIFGAWLISTSTGFLQFDLQNSISFQEFFSFQLFPVVLSVIFLGGVLFFLVFTRGKGFIQDEVSEQIQRFKEQGIGFLRRTNIDLIMFAFGAISAILSFLVQGLRIDVNIPGILAFFLYVLGPFLLWIGGGAVGIRLASWVPFKLEKPVFSTRLFSDIQRIIKSGLRRRGDTSRLAIIIILTLSIATFAASQGVTQSYNAERNLQFEIGADYQVNFQLPGDYMANVSAPGTVANALPVGQTGSIRILSSVLSAVGFDVGSELDRLRNGEPVAIWQDDTFDGLSAEEALSLLETNQDGVLVSVSLLQSINAEVGDTVNLKIDRPLNETSSEIVTFQSIEILGTYNYLPGGFIGNNILGSENLVNDIRAVAAGLNRTAYDNQMMNASTYLVDLSKDSLSQDEVNSLLSDWSQIQGYNDAVSLEQEIENQGTGSYGIPGLLTLNFFVSVVAAFISTFTFSAIILERRKQEFAVLRAVGASKRQVYKIAMAENLLLVLTTVIWGSIIGLGLTYQFNGVFSFFGQILGTGSLVRLVVFPWQLIISIGLGTTLGMLLATMISVRSAANQDLSIATRVV